MALVELACSGRWPYIAVILFSAQRAVVTVFVVRMSLGGACPVLGIYVPAKNALEERVQYDI